MSATRTLPPGSGEVLEPATQVLRGFALLFENELVTGLWAIAAAPFRHMVTPGGYPMSVAMTNCGLFG